MWRTRIIAIWVSIACVVSLFTIEASSSTMPSHSLSDEERNSFLQRIHWEPIDNDSHKSSICCFDVATDGTIALAISGEAIYVYDKQGVFLYGRSFRSDGDFGIEFDDDELALHFLRGNTILLIDDSGKCIDIQKVDDSTQHILHMKEIHSQTFLEIGNTKYLLEREIDIGDSYSRFVIEESGKRMVLYDISGEHIAGQILTVISIACFFAFVINGIKNKYNK